MSRHRVLLSLLLAACSSNTSLPDGGDLPRDRGLDVRPDQRRDLPLDRAVRDTRPDTPADRFADAAKPDVVPKPDADPFPKGPYGCMGTSGALTLLGTIGNIAVYAGCPGSAPNTFLFVWGGTVGALTASDLGAIQAKHSTALLALPGVNGHGVGLCCVPSKNAACITLYGGTSLTAWDLAKQLDQVFKGETACFGVMAEVLGKPAPRCAPTSTECKPIPICSGPWDPICCTPPPFNPGAARVPTLPKTSPIYSLELPQSVGECTHDGECVLNGCGNHCTAYTAASFLATCPCYPALKNSYCGCVAGECVWYEQK